MKLTFLGTGAADWSIHEYAPSAFFRRNSSALVNDDLLIDPGPHVFHFAETSGQPHLLDHVKNIIVTHAHSDHFYPDTVAHLCLEQGAALWADTACLRVLQQAWGAEKAARVEYHPLAVSHGEPITIGAYTVWSLPANHVSQDANDVARLYVVGDGERLLYYGCDSAWIPTPSWNVIKTMPLNAMVLECTCGEGLDWRLFEHNTIDMLSIMVRTFRDLHLFAPDVRYYSSHMARTLHADHATLVSQLAPLGVTPAYDGLTIEIGERNNQ